MDAIRFGETMRINLSKPGNLIVMIRVFPQRGPEGWIVLNNARVSLLG